MGRVTGLLFLAFSFCSLWHSGYGPPAGCADHETDTCSQVVRLNIIIAVDYSTILTSEDQTFTNQFVDTVNTIILTFIADRRLGGEDIRIALATANEQKAVEALWLDNDLQTPNEIANIIKTSFGDGYLPTFNAGRLKDLFIVIGNETFVEDYGYRRSVHSTVLSNFRG